MFFLLPIVCWCNWAINSAIDIRKTFLSLASRKTFMNELNGFLSGMEGETKHMNDVKQRWRWVQWKGRLLLTSKANDSNFLIVEFGDQLPRQDLHDVGARLCRSVVMVENEKGLDIHSKNSILQVFTLDCAEQIDFALFQPSKHYRRNRDVGGLLDVTNSIIICAPTIQDDDFLLIGAAASQLLYQAVLVN